MASMRCWAPPDLALRARCHVAAGREMALPSLLTASMLPCHEYLC